MKIIVKPRKNQFYDYCFCTSLFGSDSCGNVCRGNCRDVCHSHCGNVGGGQPSPSSSSSSSSSEQEMFGSEGLFGQGGLFGSH